MTIFPLSIDDIRRYDLRRVAIEHRQEEVFNLFLRNYPNNEVDGFWPAEQANTSHVAAKLTYCPKITSIASAAFQMQKELQWFNVSLSAFLTT